MITDRQLPIEPVKLITGHIAPTHCPECKSPRFAIEGPRVVFACNSALMFLYELPGERRDPHPKQTLKCIALAKAGGWKRAVA